MSRWPWSHLQRGRLPVAQKRATQRRPLGPSPEPTVTSSPAATAARERPRPTISHLPFLRVPVFPESSLTPPPPSVITLAPLRLPLHAPLPLMTTNLHSSTGTTVATPTSHQQITAMISPTVQPLQEDVRPIGTVFAMQEVPQISPPAHGN